MAINYKEAGVDREAGYKEVEKIKDIVKRTNNENVLSKIGGFSGLFKLPIEGMEEPVLVSGTDGVGTKLKLAFMTGIHNTIGQDVVAMCVNDILCQGAKPLFFLDYIGTGVLEADKMASIVEGVANGCVLAESALIGGETAEMPGFYEDGEYDIAGFAVGVVDKKKIIDGSKIKKGDKILCIKSSGVHSNGFSLVRKLVFEEKNIAIDTYFDELGKTIGEELLTPTKIYQKVVKNINSETDVHGYVHITGGGLYENVPRIVPEGLKAKFNLENYQIPPIFKLLQKWGEVETKEMFSTFNMGIGLVVILDKEDLDKVKEKLDSIGEEYMELGEIVEATDSERIEVCL